MGKFHCYNGYYNKMKGKVQTVLGPVEPNTLGVTLTHEHLLHELPLEVFRHPLPKNIPPLKDSPFTVGNLGWLRQYPYCFDDNNIYTDEGVRKAVKEEMHFFKQVGGGTIVDNGSIGLRAKDQVQFLTTLSKETGVNVVTGTGFYVVFAQSQSVISMKVEEMAAKIRDDILNGIDDTGIKCGVIGEIGCSWPLDDFERKSLVSSAIVQEETGCPVIIHPGRDKESPEEIFRVFQEAGGKIGHTVMSHLERTLHTKQDLAEFASLGSYCEFDLFGIEVSYYQHNEDIDMPSDAQRIKRLHYLIEQGFGDKIVISHDIHTKHRLMKYGGHGFSHIIANVVPNMKKRGFSEDHIRKILINNPQKWLTFE
ncbi:phosphotriesterase-related protein [Nephila pilipes]|uniref:Phosphotriesterase-related protein n=1 Tax=Nephila pilipes TaxID=299642 RepID=A0A8X6MA22_NEPPI|nr:phosphotriesterase-related protein [Nephila pilipes]